MPRNPVKRTFTGNSRHSFRQVTMKKVLPATCPTWRSKRHLPASSGKNFPARYLHKKAHYSFSIGCDMQDSTFQPIHSDTESPFGQKKGRCLPFSQENAAFFPMKKAILPLSREYERRMPSFLSSQILRRGKSILCSPARPEGTRLHAQTGHTTAHRSRCAGQPCRQELHC